MIPERETVAPTYWPAALALGSALLVWGLLASYVISAVGFVIVIASLSGWIADLVRAHRAGGECRE